VGPRDLDSGDGWNDGYEQYKLLIGLSAIVDIVPYKVTNTVLSKIKVPKLNLLLKHFYMMVSLGIAKGEEDASSLDKGERRTARSTVLAGQTFARGTGLLVLYFHTYPHASDYVLAV
jgi:hypothetical protein